MLPIQKLSLTAALESMRIDIDGTMEDLDAADAADITEYADALIAMLKKHYGGKA